MKRLLAAAAVFFALSAFTVVAGLVDVINGLRAGSAEAIAKYFDNTVEISLPGKSNNYSRSQGEAVLRDFFANHPVKSFTVNHRGASGGSSFCIGTLTTNSGTFRTTVNVKQRGDKEILQGMKFEN